MVRERGAHLRGRKAHQTRGIARLQRVEARGTRHAGGAVNRTGRVWAALGLVTVVLMSACSADASAPSPSIGTATSSTPSPSRTVTTAATPPVTGTTRAVSLPPEATQHTEAGAQAFARFYLEQYSAAAHAGDASLMRGLARPECQGCSALVHLVEGMEKKKQHIDIDALVVHSAWTVPGSTDSTAVISVLAEEAPKRIIDTNGVVVANVKGARFDFRLTEPWGPDGWTVSDLRLMR